MILLGLGLGVLLVAGLAARVFARRPRTADLLFGWGGAAGCALALIPAVARLIGAPPAGAEASAHFGIDLLSAWFLLLVLGVGGMIAIYGVPYLRVERDHPRVGRAHLLVAIVIAALSGVVTARTVIAFLACWEVMALASYFLVIFEHERPEVWGAGMVYLVLTHACSLALIGMFAAWAGGHPALRFDELARNAASGQFPAGLVLILGLIAFGTKAGAFPFHFWLPGAHAAAPSHVSALLSGILLKVGIYGLLRMLTLIGTPPAWWGWTVLLMGVASAVLGVLWALAQHDLKRLLAYHSVENIGIILIGLGLGALGTAYRQPAVALLGYAGALLHTLNHALFKSLLFLGAGAVTHETGTREIDRLGGLARRIPRTALAFLIGCIAIVGLPPLNGFVSEWLIFRGLFGTVSGGGHVRVAAVAAIGLALTGALALACFTKVYGIIFLGTPRAPGAASPHRELPGMLAPQWILAAACIAIGIVPAPFVSIAVRTARLITPQSIAGDGLSGPTAGTLTLSVLSASLLAVVALIAIGRRATLASRRRVSAPTWGCAFAGATHRMQYTASSFASPVLISFGPVSGTRVARTPGAFRTHALEPILDLLGRPLWNRVVTAATRLRPLQARSVRWYLLYAIACLFGLLLYLRFVALP